MLIERGQSVSGVDVVLARDVLRAMQGGGLSIDGVTPFLRTWDWDPASLVVALESAGLIERVEVGRGDVWWRPTLNGNRLAKARIGKPIPRAKGQTSLDALLDRVNEVNADQYELFRVETVELFGSFNDASRETVGDVDVRLVYSCTIDTEDLIEQSLTAATASGRNLSFVGAMFFSTTSSASDSKAATSTSSSPEPKQSNPFLIQTPSWCIGARNRIGLNMWLDVKMLCA